MGALVADTISFSTVDGPGNRLVVFLQGCNFDCIACHNPQTIPGHAFEGEHAPTRMSVDEVIVAIRRAAPFLSGITVSGGEATQQAGFVHDLFAAVHADPELARLTCFVDSNGACSAATWQHLAPVMEGAMIDLKCLDPQIHQAMTGEPNDEVLASIRQLHECGLLYEVRLLVLAGVNDDPGLVRRTAQWLATIDERMRIKVIGFRSHGARPHDPELIEPTPAALQRIADLLHEVAPFDVCIV